MENNSDDSRVQAVLCIYGFGEIAIGKSYQLRNGLAYAYFYDTKINGRRIKSVNISDIVFQYPCKAFEWIVLHECGHICYNHTLDRSGRANVKDELDADFWACCKQHSPEYGIQALELMSNCNREAERMSVKWEERGEWYRIGSLTYGYSIDEIRNRWRNYTIINI